LEILRRARQSFLLAVLIAAPVSAFAQTELDAYDFWMSDTFLKELAKQNSVNFKIAVRLEHRTAKVHTLAADCEIHIAVGALGGQLFPEGVVVEPPNLCKERAPGMPQASETELREQLWPQWLDQRVMNKDCEVTGFPRLFTEHAAGGTGAANPDHFFEMHPALAIKPVSGGEEMNFRPFLKYYKGMRSIKAETAAKCMEGRKLSIRTEKHKCFFKEEGGGCGNFMLVHATIPARWIRKINGGHSAIARVTPPEQATYSLKIYTLDQTSADGYLADLQTRNVDGHTYFHGLLSYDYFAIVRAALGSDGALRKITQWKKIPFPLALLVFGEVSDLAPDENDD